MADSPRPSNQPSGANSPVPSPSPLPIPSRYPHEDLEDNAHVHSSPAFDYHEERRLHLKDEIWLSHNLPRLPPSTISEAGSSTGKLAEMSTSARLGMSPGHFMTTSPLNHTKPMPTGTSPGEVDLGNQGKNLEKGGQSMSLTQDNQEQDKDDHEEESDFSSRFQRQAQINPAERHSSMLSPSGPEYGDLDPAPSIIHRQERDKQEELDLEEEARERELNVGLLNALNSGGRGDGVEVKAAAKLAAAGGGAQQVQPERNGVVLHVGSHFIGAERWGTCVFAILERQRIRFMSSPTFAMASPKFAKAIRGCVEDVYIPS
ncbi:hypothetical protein I302_104325 [Kwoniella bestiolae CBS 10118]|uniref:Uncharacterized protein n=1 Tax=Kwoniella bestiolae CBS 10118 TaxID=1296100 RepID=A0A1B9GB09_9TREE|nr:hypothetical protein I302_03033 [Kwoniella bestiolae CBS 10118]OCF28182.1 hypothetical protein I302_03033 [Kwoniella bestiolae CBS 10118]